MIPSKVTAVLLNWWILPIGGVALGRVYTQPAKQASLLHQIRGTLGTLY